MHPSRPDELCDHKQPVLFIADMLEIVMASHAVSVQVLARAEYAFLSLVTFEALGGIAQVCHFNV